MYLYIYLLPPDGLKYIASKNLALTGVMIFPMTRCDCGRRRPQDKEPLPHLCSRPQAVCTG